MISKFRQTHKQMLGSTCSHSEVLRRRTMSQRRRLLSQLCIWNVRHQTTKKEPREKQTAFFTLSKTFVREFEILCFVRKTRFNRHIFSLNCDMNTTLSHTIVKIHSKTTCDYLRLSFNYLSPSCLCLCHPIWMPITGAGQNKNGRGYTMTGTASAWGWPFWGVCWTGSEGMYSLSTRSLRAW